MIDTFTKKKVPIPNVLKVSDNQVENHGVFRILSQADGDKRIVWNRFSIPEIGAAEKLFEELRAEGMVPYKVGTDGNKSSEKLDKFDPAAEEIIFIPTQAIVGG